MGLKKNEKLGDELQFLSAKNALSRSGGFVTADGTRQIRKYTHHHHNTTTTTVTTTCTEKPKYLLLIHNLY
jgi:hypothetical protein